MTQWPEAVATVTFVDGVYDEGPPSVKISFEYRDGGQSLQMGKFIVDSFSGLYNLKVDDTFTIRFNPRKPSQFYSPELATWFTQTKWLFWIGMAVTAAVTSVIMLLRHR